jgi:hypothetical protein
MKRIFFIFSLMLLVFGYGVVGAQVATPTDFVVYSTGQFFENGVMIWRADTGFVWALARDGQVFNFPLNAYASLPENRNRENRTFGPSFGFGKIWANNPQIRDLFGGAIWQEVGFNMGVHQEGSTYYLRQTNGTIYKIMPNNTWEYAPEMPDSDVPIIYAFDVWPNPATPGENISLNWSMAGAELALIETYDVTNDALIGLIPDLPLAGSTTFAIPIGTSATAIEFRLYAANQGESDADGRYKRLLYSIATVAIQPPIIYENNPGATFQQFERGFMIWRADTNDIYVLYDAGNLGANGGGPYTIYSGSQYAHLPNERIRIMAAGRIQPENGFNKVWSNHVPVRDQLGWATGPEIGYLAAARLENSVPVAITIPDGRTVYLNPSGNWWNWFDTLD